MEYLQTVRVLFSRKNLVMPKLWAKRAQNWQQKRIFWIFWKILSLVIPGNNLKWKLILLLTFHHQSHICQFWLSCYGPKCCWPIKLQDSLKCNVSIKKWMINCINRYADKPEVIYKLILLFWVWIVRHAQSTQNMFAYLCNLFGKTWLMKLTFYLRINLKVFYKLLVSVGCLEPGVSKKFKITSLQYLCNISTKIQRMMLIFACR